MKIVNVLIVFFWLIFVLPLIGYLAVNFYWWLFDGNVLNAEKMIGALCVLIFTGFIGAFLAGEVWG